jgi:hypothetical protein
LNGAVVSCETVAKRSQKLLSIPEQLLGIQVQPDGFYTDVQVELVVLTGAFNVSKQLHGTVLQVLSNTASM